MHPLHIVIRTDRCTLVVHDPACNDRRNFELSRVQQAVLGNATFAWPRKG